MDRLSDRPSDGGQILAAAGFSGGLRNPNGARREAPFVEPTLFPDLRPAVFRKESHLFPFWR